MQSENVLSILPFEVYQFAERKKKLKTSHRLKIETLVDIIFNI